MQSLMKKLANTKEMSQADKLQYLYLLKEKAKRLKTRLARQSYLGFVREMSPEAPPARHHELIIDRLDQVNKGEIKRLMLFLPPGTAKSTYSSILFPPYWLLSNPRKLIIAASHSGDLAERFGRKTRNMVADPDYSNLFGLELKADSKAAGRWEVTNEAEYYAVGVRGSVTGRRGDLGLIDDPVKGAKEADSAGIQEDVYQWYLSDFRTRLKPKAAIVLMMTRWREDDLAGRILPEDYDGRSGTVQARDGESWEVLNLPMEARGDDIMGRDEGELLWPGWFTPEWVAQEKRIQGTRNWNALYQQTPTADEGDYFKRDDMRWYKRRPKNLKTYLTGDYAVTEGGGDFTVMLVWGVDANDDIYLLNGFRGQTDILDTIDRFIDLVDQYDPMIALGESGVIRRAMEPILKKRMREKKVFCKLEWLPTVGDKPAMSRSFQALTQNGVIHFKEGSMLAENGLAEMTKFPFGKNDDFVDACGLLGRHINKVWKAKRPDKAEKPVVIDGNRPISAPTFTMSDFEEEI